MHVTEAQEDRSGSEVKTVQFVKDISVLSSRFWIVINVISATNFPTSRKVDILNKSVKYNMPVGI